MDETKAKQDFQKRFDKDCRSVGMKGAFKKMRANNARLDALKERGKKLVIEQQVSNSYMSGVRGGFSGLGTRDWQDVQKNAGRRRYVATPDGLILKE